MAWTHWRRLLTPTWLLIGATLTAFDCELGVGPVGPGPAETNPPPPRPPRPPSGPAIEIEVRPNLIIYPARPYVGEIRDGSYVDSLRLYGHIIENSIVAMVLRAGEGRPGTYSVTVTAPGYVTWDTAGVIVGVGLDSSLAHVDSVVRTVHLYHELQETP